ncbi:MAG: ADOP family duplicated permease [Gemmatimonadota bacterium]
MSWPHAWARALTRRAAPPALWSVIDEELKESERVVAERWGPRRARLWSTGQYLGVAARLGVERGASRTIETVTDWGATGFGLDARIAARRLRQRRGRTAIIVSTIALAIGCTTAVFSVVYGVLLRPLDFPESDRLVRVWQTEPELVTSTSASFRAQADRLMPQAPEVFEWANADLGFDAVGGYVDAGYVLQGPDGVQSIRGQEATSGFFAALRTEPLLGRALAPSDDVAGAEAVVVLSEALWESRFGRSENALGASLTLDGRPHAVVGVMPAGFAGPALGRLEQLIPPGAPLLWTPLTEEARRGWKNVSALARLTPGVPEVVARDRLQGYERAWAEENPGTTRAERPPRTEPLVDSIVGSVRTTLWLLFGSVSLVLLVAGLNIIHVVVATGFNDVRDVAVRVALGAGRGRVVRGLFVESAMATVLGGFVGLTLAWVLTPALAGLLPPTVPRQEAVAMSWPVIVFGLGITAAAACAVGVLPALAASGVEPNRLIRGGDRGGTEGRGVARIRSGLVVAEVATAFVLLITAASLANSFVRLWSEERGFDTGGLVALRVAPDRTQFRSDEEVETFHRDFDAALDALPGISASAVNSMPLSGLRSGQSAFPERPGEGAFYTNVTLSVARPDYLEVLGADVLLGRGIDEGDTRDSEPVALVNETLAAMAWPEGALGQSLRIGDDSTRALQVIGVVRDVRHTGLHVEVEPKVVIPSSQSDRSTEEWVLRVSSGVEDAVGMARSALGEISPTTPIIRVLVLEDAVSRSVAVPRFRATFVVGLALLAAALALVGLYGVLTFSVVARSKELGVRMALGASDSRVVREVLSGGLRLVVLGIGVGAVVALSVSDAVAGFLYDADSIGFGTYATVAALVLAVSVLAAAMPARRAATVDPVVALSEG